MSEAAACGEWTPPLEGQPDTPWIVTKSDQNGASHVSRLTFILGTRVLLWATYVAIFLYLQSGTCLLLLLFFFK